MFSVLVADDEKAIRESIKDYLEAKGYSVKTATDGESALELFYENSFDLVILDVMMPKVDGFDACRAVRRASNLPVLFLTAKGQEADFLKGFECGCDDYVVKPFPLSVLYEKCNSLIKRYKGIDSANWIKVSGVALDLSCKRAYVGENEIKLSSKDFKILCYLMENKNIVLNRELILTFAWGYDFDGDDRVVDTHIKRIRKALGEKAECIKTIILL
jgi:two-component system response regulator ResD